MTILTNRFKLALNTAFQLHIDQNRKGSTTPYFAHLISVAALIVEMGGNEDEAIAGLLHDAVEDQGGLDTLELIRSEFGDNVANIVLECSDSFTTPKPPWKERKDNYLEHLQHASNSVKIVSLADKLHNARSIYYDLIKNGDETWKRFNGGKEGTLWYYSELAKVFRESMSGIYTDEFIEMVNKIISFKPISD